MTTNNMACAIPVSFGRKHDYTTWMNDRADIFVEDVTRTVTIEPCPTYDIPQRIVEYAPSVQNIVSPCISSPVAQQPTGSVQCTHPSFSIWEKIQTLTNLGELVVNVMQIFS